MRWATPIDNTKYECTFIHVKSWVYISSIELYCTCVPFQDDGDGYEEGSYMYFMNEEVCGDGVGTACMSNCISFVILQVVMHREQIMRQSPSVSTSESLEQTKVIGLSGTGLNSGSQATVPEGIIATPTIANAPFLIPALNTEGVGAISPLFPSLNKAEVDFTPRVGSASHNKTDGNPNRERHYGQLFLFWNSGCQ
jgi:hypothetical protein